MIEIQNGALVIDREAVKVGNLIFKDEISRGANGIVFLATDNNTGRDVAFKIWLKLKMPDFRDKKIQGKKETEKQTKARQVLSEWHDPKLDNPYFIPDKSDVIIISENTVGKVYQTGVFKDYFCATMELIEGVTLKKFLEDGYDSFTATSNSKISRKNKALPFGVKVNIALKLVRYNAALMNNGVVHGDLHWKNIMITNSYNPSINHSLCLDQDDGLKILDFGTSVFSGKATSKKRTFNTLIESINHCIEPLKIENIKACDQPTDIRNVNAMTTWIEKQLFAIRAAFFELNQEYVGWPLYGAFGTYQLTTKGFDMETKYVKETILRFVAEGKIELSEQFLGTSKDWDTFDGRTAKRGD